MYRTYRERQLGSILLDLPAYLLIVPIIPTIQYVLRFTEKYDTPLHLSIPKLLC